MYCGRISYLISHSFAVSIAVSDEVKGIVPDFKGNLLFDIMFCKFGKYKIKWKSYKNESWNKAVK